MAAATTTAFSALKDGEFCLRQKNGTSIIITPTAHFPAIGLEIIRQATSDLPVSSQHLPEETRSLLVSKLVAYIKSGNFDPNLSNHVKTSRILSSLMKEEEVTTANLITGDKEKDLAVFNCISVLSEDYISKILNGTSEEQYCKVIERVSSLSDSSQVKIPASSLNFSTERCAAISFKYRDKFGEGSDPVFDKYLNEKASPEIWLEHYKGKEVSSRILDRCLANSDLLKQLLSKDLDGIGTEDKNKILSALSKTQDTALFSVGWKKFPEAYLY
jgi:predicted transcriptional regulator